MSNLDLYLNMIGMIILMISVLLSVAFLTLLERKVLGYIQFRRGPNKVGFLGILQPFNDAIKLFSKEYFIPYFSNFISYFFSPILSLLLSLLVWILMPYMINFFNFNLSLLFFLCVSSLSVYLVMVAGWSSNSNYAMLGSLRAISQAVSYEVTMSLMFLILIFFIMEFNFMMFNVYQKNIWFIFLSLPVGISLISIMLAELNRTPFDFAEGESELVSGFNVEYGGSGFALLFLSEYSNILFMSMLFCLFFLGGNLESLIFYFKLVFFSFLVIWIRAMLPRYRYDKLMYLTWKSYLPLSLNMLLFIFSFKMF